MQCAQERRDRCSIRCVVDSWRWALSCGVVLSGGRNAGGALVELCSEEERCQ